MDDAQRRRLGAMAQVQLDEGEDPELRVLARRIIAAQRREIAAMRERLG